MSCLAAVLPARLAALCVARGVLVWRPSARSECLCDLCGVPNRCPRVPLPFCGAVPCWWSSAVLCICMLCPVPAPDGSPAPPRYPCLPGGYHVALWRAAEGGAYHGHAAFALFWEETFSPITEVSARPPAKPPLPENAGRIAFRPRCLTPAGQCEHEGRLAEPRREPCSQPTCSEPKAARYHAEQTPARTALQAWLPDG